MRYDTRFGYYGACYVTNDNGESGGGGGGNGNSDSKPNGGSKQDPPWKSEFGDEFDPDKAWNLIKNLRGSERRLRNEKETAEGKVKEFEDASKSETEKLLSDNEGLKKRISELEGQIAQAAIGGEVANVAKKLGAVYPEDVYALVSSKLVIEDGKAKNIEDVVKELAEARPMLFQGSNIDQNKNNKNGNGAAGNENAFMNDAIRGGFGRRG